MIRHYNDFISELMKAGFSGAVGGKDDGAFALFRYGWGAENDPAADTGIEWHTGDPDTDPWEWRVRVLNERGDVAYAKLFYKKAGYITKDWYPYFLAVRRGGTTFEEAYQAGTISHFAKRIYEVVAGHDCLPLNEIKRLARFSREDKSKFDAALTDLQMKMFLTISGVKRNLSREGKEYGWTTTVFSTTELFFGEGARDGVFEKAAVITPDEARRKITGQIKKLNPAAAVAEKKINKFIFGM